MFGVAVMIAGVSSLIPLSCSVVDAYDSDPGPTTGLVSEPMPSISTSTTSPGDRCRWRIHELAAALRRAREDHVARIQGEAARAELEQVRHVEDHAGGRVVLHHLAVDLRGQAEIVDRPELVGGDHHRPERAEGVEALAARPLPVAELQVAGGDVVGDRVAEHVVECPLGRDPSHPAADDDRELDLPVDPLGEVGVDHDRGAGADHARGELGEDQRSLGRLDARIRRRAPGS